jgi:hypothetical protein
MKVDLYRAHPEEYATPATPAIVNVRAGTYLAVSGNGAPGGPEFQEKMGALFALTYTTKMAFRSSGKDFRVMPVEGVWEPGAAGATDAASLADARWTLQIRVPDFVSPPALRAAESILEARGRVPPQAREVRAVRRAEGRCVQMLHVGPYDAERDDLAAMTRYADTRGYVPTGLHHEIYLSDPRRVPSPRLRTILRLPVRRRSRSAVAQQGSTRSKSAPAAPRRATRRMSIVDRTFRDIE